MSRFQAEPDPRLKLFVHSYWGLVRDLSETGGFTVTPDRFMELIFFVDPPRVEGDAGPQKLSACTLVSLLREPLRVVANGVVRCAAVRLHAWAAGIVFPRVDTSRQPWFDVAGSFADAVPAVCAALREDRWEEITARFDALMRRALAEAYPAAAAMAATRAFASPPADGAAADATGKVAARQGRSRRQIERQVRSLTHRSPKQLACLTRFQFVRDTLWTRPGTELAALAFEAGYADQAHLTRHFRRYAAQTPGEFIRECARLRASLRKQDVADVQDGP